MTQKMTPKIYAITMYDSPGKAELITEAQLNWIRNMVPSFTEEFIVSEVVDLRQKENDELGEWFYTNIWEDIKNGVR